MTNDKLLFAIDNYEFRSNQGRLLSLVRMLSDDGYHIDILTTGNEVLLKAIETFGNNEKVNIAVVTPDVVQLEGSFKVDLLKAFIRQTHNLLIPETDMKIYKLAAFDDFQGFISPHTYPAIDISPYSLILMPLISVENWPSFESDCFYSALCFLAKEKKVPVIGLQKHPPMHNVFLYVKLMDYIVVKEEWERRYIERLGIERDRIFLLTDEKEVYCLKNVEVRYKNFLLESMDDKDIEIAKKEFCIIVFNHPKFRPQIKEALSVIEQLGIPAAVFLIKTGYFVKELEEQEIIDSIYGHIINKMKCRLYFADSDTMDKLLPLADVIVSSTYSEALGQAAGYGKTVVVYNEIFRDVETGNGVIFTDDSKRLKEMILRRYNEKMSGYSCLADLVKKIIGH